MTIEEILKSAPESGFSTNWLKDKLADAGTKMSKAQINQYLDDIGLVKTRNMWHPPRVSTFNSKVL